MNEPVASSTKSETLETNKGEEEHHSVADGDNKKKRKKRVPYGNLKKKKKEKKTVVVGNVDVPKGRKMSQEDEPISDKNSIPHEGSFACLEMQKLFNVQLPEEPVDQTRASKKKVALLLGYLGSNYAGFQINKDQLTLQAELELAIFKAGLLQKLNFGFPHKYSWSTSGRTDKGVHACAQVCSIKLEMGEASEDEVRERINEHLPNDVRVLDVKRTTRNFHAKTMRSRVRYQYMIPSYMFFPNTKQMFDEEKVEINLANKNDSLTSEQLSSLRGKLKDYRITPEQLATLKKALGMYHGTKHYHNFTRGMMPGDKASQRYILEFVASDPVVREDGTEWIPTQVLGQSFLLNQIRKMIALACDVVSERATFKTMEYSFDKTRKMNLPIAPAQGLFMDMSVYDDYNQRKNKDSDHGDLNWIDIPDSPAMQRWKVFKDQVVMKKIVEEEADEGNFIKFMYIHTHVFTDWNERYLLNGGEDVAADESDQALTED